MLVGTLASPVARCTRPSDGAVGASKCSHIDDARDRGNGWPSVRCRSAAKVSGRWLSPDTGVAIWPETPHAVDSAGLHVEAELQTGPRTVRKLVVMNCWLHRRV